MWSPNILSSCCNVLLVGACGHCDGTALCCCPKFWGYTLGEIFAFFRRFSPHGWIGRDGERQVETGRQGDAEALPCLTMVAFLPDNRSRNFCRALMGLSGMARILFYLSAPLPHLHAMATISCIRRRRLHTTTIRPMPFDDILHALPSTPNQ